MSPVWRTPARLGLAACSVRPPCTRLVGFGAIVVVCAMSTSGVVWARGPVQLPGGIGHLAFEQRSQGDDVAVATVGTSVITRSEFTHWLRIIHAEHEKSDRHRCRIGGLSAQQLQSDRRAALEFLVFARWVDGEARERGIRVSQETVRRERQETKRLAFDSERAYRRFLKRTCQTTKDISRRVRLDLLGMRIRRQVLAGSSGAAERQRVLDEFKAAFTEKWRARTSCQPGYEAPGCPNV